MSTHPLRLTLALCLALLPAHASASLCQETPFQKLMREADVIFVGRALTWDGELTTTFAVERVHKGSVAARVVVESGANKYAALAPPDRYLVLADADNPDAKPGNLYVHTCGGSRRLLAPTDLPKQLGDGNPPLPVQGPPPEVSPDPPPTPEPTEPPTDPPTGSLTDPPFDPDAPATPWPLPPPPPPARPVDPPGLSRDSYYLLIAPGILAIDLREPHFRFYTWGLSGGRLFTGAGHFAAAIGGFFEHNLWINRVNPERGDRARFMSFVRIGPEMRIGASNERVFGYALLRAGLDVLVSADEASFLAAGGLGIQGALLENRRLLLGAEPIVDYSYPLDYAFFRLRVFIGARF